MTTTRRTLLKPADAAAELEVAVRTLANWRVQGIGPRFIRLGGGTRGPIRYEQEEVDAYKASRTKSSTSDVSTEDRGATAPH